MIAACNLVFEMMDKNSKNTTAVAWTLWVLRYFLVLLLLESELSQRRQVNHSSFRTQTTLWQKQRFAQKQPADCNQLSITYSLLKLARGHVFFSGATRNGVLAQRMGDHKVMEMWWGFYLGELALTSKGNITDPWLIEPAHSKSVFIVFVNLSNWGDLENSSTGLIFQRKFVYVFVFIPHAIYCFVFQPLLFLFFIFIFFNFSLLLHGSPG